MQVNIPSIKAAPRVGFGVSVSITRCGAAAGLYLGRPAKRGVDYQAWPFCAVLTSTPIIGKRLHVFRNGEYA